MTMIRKIKNLIKHQGLRRYAANTSWMMAEQMLRIVAGLLVGIWVARYLGPEQFGLFSYVLAFTAIFAGVAKLGLDGILVRELVNYPERRDTYLGTAFWLKAIGAALVMIIMAAIVPFTSNNQTTNLYIFIVAFGLIFQSFEVVEFYFQSKVLAKVISICKAIQLAISSLIKIYLVLTQADLVWFVCVTALDTISLAVSYFVAYKIRGNVVFFKAFNKKIAKELLKDSWPLIFSSLVVMIYMRIDQIMIKEMLGDYEVGVYSAAVRLIEVIYFIPTLLAKSLFPAILNAKKASSELYSSRMLSLYRSVTIIAILFLIFIALFNETIILHLYGEQYSESAQILQAYSYSTVFVFFLVISGMWYISENHKLLALYRNIVAALINISMNFILIPRYGIVGAAYSTLFSFFLSGYVFDIFFHATREQFRLKSKALLVILR